MPGKPPSPGLLTEARLLSRAGRIETTVQDVELSEEQRETAEGVRTTRKGHPLITLYRPWAGHWRATDVPANSLIECLRAGWRETCGDCNGTHDVQPNACPGRKPVALRLCPICPKVISDDMPVIDRTARAIDPDDPNIIRDDEHQFGTPEIRTRAKLEEHIRWKHPVEGRAMGIMPLPETGRLVV